MGKSILIVDDEPHIRELLEQVLEDLVDDLDLTLHIAKDGLEAIDIIKASSPDVVVLDVMMPRMNGYEVCEIIKNDKDNNCFVVMLTAKGQEFDRAHGTMVGADLYLTKPFEPSEVLEVVRKAIES